MTADLSREEIERLDRDLLDRISRGIYGDAPAPIDVRMWLRVVKHLLSEPTRLAAARAEGYREGVEAAARWHDDQATDLERRVEMREGQFISGMDRVARVHRCDAAAIRALSPAPAEPSAPVAPETWEEKVRAAGAKTLPELLALAKTHTMTPAEKWVQRVSMVWGLLDEGAAATLTKEQVSEKLREMYGSPDAARIATLEGENAALREVFDAACAMDGFGMFDDLESPSGVRMREATRRARALEEADHAKPA